MKKKNWNWIQYAIIFVVLAGMLLSIPSSVSVYAADLYLAYQADENGTAVTKLKSSQREKYRVSKLYLEERQKVDLCFINAVSWKNAQWKSSNPEVATVDSAGVVTAVSAGVTEITLTYSKKYTGAKISASAMVYVGEENWDIQFLSIYAEEREGCYEVRAGESIDFIFNGISKMDNPDIYSMSLKSSDEGVTTVSTVSGLTVTTTKPGIVTVTLDIKNKVTGNVIHKNVLIKSWITVQEKMDYLLKQLGVEPGKEVYFTVNQDACTEHYKGGNKNGCLNCSITNITQDANWFKNIFGKVDVTCFPRHVWGNPSNGEIDFRGKSCFGFMCFAQWYLYADYLDEKVTATWGEPVEFTKENMRKYAQPGDVIRVSGHSLLVYSVEEECLKVIDSNRTESGKYPHCLVRFYDLRYDSSFVKNQPAYIHRVADSNVAGMYLGKTTDTELSPLETTVTPTSEPGNTWHGSLDLSATGWTSYNVGLDKDMNATKAYTIHHASEFEILGEYMSKKGNKVYHVYSYELGMECYVTAKYVKLDSSEKEVYGILDLSATSWTTYNVGTNVEMGANKAYTIRHGAKLKILGEYTNKKGNKVYHVYSYDLGMECYVTAKYVKIN